MASKRFKIIFLEKIGANIPNYFENHSFENCFVKCQIPKLLEISLTIDFADKFDDDKNLVSSKSFLCVYHIKFLLQPTIFSQINTSKETISKICFKLNQEMY